MTWGQGVEPETLLRDRRRGTTACPAWWAMGINEIAPALRKKYILYSFGPTRAGQKSLVLTWRTQRTNQYTRVHLYSLSSHFPQFKQSVGAIPLWSLWVEPILTTAKECVSLLIVVLWLYPSQACTFFLSCLCCMRDAGGGWIIPMVYTLQLVQSYHHHGTRDWRDVGERGEIKKK
jgi:hypothetical protein